MPRYTNKCPKCGEEKLTVAYSQHVEFPVSCISSAGILTEGDGECYDSSLIHINCAACNAYWYELSSFMFDAHNACNTEKCNEKA